MIRSLVSAAVLACVLVLAPTGKSEKEIGVAHASPLTETMTDLLFATVRDHPCALIVMASNDSSAAPLPKPKAKHVKSKVKKKNAHTSAKQKKKSDKHKSHSSHHGSHHAPDHVPTKISGTHGPLHLTSPPGCV